MNLFVSLKSRDFTTPVATPNVIFRPERYGWVAVGGPDFANIAASGEPRALWSLLNWLRAPIEITDERDAAVWWGFVNGVSVRAGAIEVGVSLDHMYNRIAVTYSYVAPGTNTVGTRATTGWAQDDDSVGTFGAKELLASRDGCTTEVAEAGRSALLDVHQYPIPTLGIVSGNSEVSASLHCLGWWHTLDWTYLARSAGLVAHNDGSATQSLGAESGNQRVAQSFQVVGAEGWDASTLEVRLAKAVADQEDVDDDVVVELCQDSNGPGAVLASATVDGAALDEGMAWVPFVFPFAVALAASTTYWLVLRRSGSVDGANYYKVGVDENLGYASGALRLYDGSSWNARDPDGDLAFKVAGVEETTTQLTRAVAAEGQFITAVEVDGASGVSSSQYRDGDTTLLQVVSQLLENGTSSGKRLLATIDRDRVIRVYAEPDAPASDYDTDLYIRDDGRPEDKWGNRVLTHTCPVARWCALKDVIAATVNTTVLANPSPFFIERSEFDVARQLWIPEPRGVPSPWDVGELTNR